MKKTLLLLLLAGLLALGSSVAAFAGLGNSAWIKVPFAFQAGDTLMPAGNYLFEMPRMGGFARGSMLRITSRDGSICQYLLSKNIGAAAADADWHISFAKYGDSYFLSKVRNSNYGAQIPKAASERKLASEFLRVQKAIAIVELQGIKPKAK